ncbi:hypothetical protein M422DRAFT_271003 [Sphaerobolus stellatus SS14]|uniref:Uncharacterized protein n=1 Tax=Sphaerobolus stellatus (strain SS14) TaxID=990650 RepID=A0A0C9U175_SPHS4|nr:hypothetical protein M422DRAFT_271003 [Sphaerobolus stellatus SS14]
MSNTFIRQLLHIDTRSLHRDRVIVTTLPCAHHPTSCYSLFCNLALQGWMTMHTTGTPSRLRDLILALHLLLVPVSLSPAALDMSHIEGVQKALQASMSRSLTDAITKSDKLLLLQDRRERDKDGIISANTRRLMSCQNALIWINCSPNEIFEQPWRSLVIACPLLWTRIDFAAPIHIVKEILHRSMACELDLYGLGIFDVKDKARVELFTSFFSPPLHPADIPGIGKWNIRLLLFITRSFYRSATSSLDLRAAATLALSPSHSPSSESLSNRINARKPKLNILGPLPNRKQCFMNILSIFQASTELEEISIEFNTHGQSTPTSSSHCISLKSIKNVFLIGTDAAQLMDYIEAPTLEQLSVYFRYALGLIVIHHLIPWINFPSIKALIVREKSSWMWTASIWIDFRPGANADQRLGGSTPSLDRILAQNTRTPSWTADSILRHLEMISIGIMESSYYLSKDV